MQNLLLLFAILDADENSLSDWNQMGKERWEYTAKYEEKREDLAPIFEEMGYLNEVPPQESHYDYALVIGATRWSVEKRIAYLEKCLETVTVDQIVFLTGMRPLLPAEGFGTEYDIVRELYTKTDTPVSFICAPMNGTKRPGTVETLGLWLAENPQPGCCLVITSQPFVPFHTAMLERILPFPFEIVGPKASDNWTVALLLDTIAKTVSMKKQ